MRLVSIFLSVLLAACAGTGQIDLGVTASSQLAVTGDESEAPRLLVTVERVDVHIGDDDDGEATNGDEDAGWITLFTGPTEIDLRDAATAEVFLSSTEVPTGKVTQVRLILADDPVLVTGEESQTIRCPSCTQSGLKFITRGQLSVAEDEVLHLDVVFDTAASVVADLDGLRMNPVIRLEKGEPEPAP
jgi:hypothetical protein